MENLLHKMSFSKSLKLQLNVVELLKAGVGIEELIRMISRKHVICTLGESGSGKSAVVSLASDQHLIVAKSAVRASRWKLLVSRYRVRLLQRLKNQKLLK